MNNPAIFNFSLVKSLGLVLHYSWYEPNKVITFQFFCFILDIQWGRATRGWFSWYNEFSKYEN